MINKNVSQYALVNWNSYKSSVTEISKSSNGTPLVENDYEVYNFDVICMSMFDQRNLPQSADGITINVKAVELIEFKSGFKRVITKDSFDEVRATCDKTGEVCKDYWGVFLKNKKLERYQLIESLKLKAIESYQVLEKHIFPDCEDNNPCRCSRLVFTVVVDVDAVEGIESVLADLSGTDSTPNNILVSIRQSLKKYLKRLDCKGAPYYYDEIKVLTVQDFNNYINSISQ